MHTKSYFQKPCLYRFVCIRAEHHRIIQENWFTFVEESSSRIKEHISTVNHRDFDSKVSRRGQSRFFSHRGIEIARRAPHSKIVVWSGLYHSRVFYAFEAELGIDRFYYGMLPWSCTSPQGLDVEKTIGEALNDSATLAWPDGSVKAVVISKVLHVAVRVHLSCETVQHSPVYGLRV